MNQLNKIEIPQEWILTRGAGVVVGVLDSHIEETSDVFKNNVKKYCKLTKTGIYDTSHCTSVCQVIANIAPLCNIQVYQALTNTTCSIDSMVLAINELLKDDVDIVNCSVSTTSNRQLLKRKIDTLSEKAIIIASLSNTNRSSFPANYTNVISVASFKHTNREADIYCDDKFSFKDMNIKKTGNSMSSAFISGIFALAKSYDKNMTRERFFKQLLGR